MEFVKEQIEAAKSKCYEVCKTDAFYDPENGCFGACKSKENCTGWVPFIAKEPTP